MREVSASAQNGASEQKVDSNGKCSHVQVMQVIHTGAYIITKKQPQECNILTKLEPQNIWYGNNEV